MLGSFIDVTDLKQAQEKLEKTNDHLLRVIDDLDTFVYTASHDLKSPVLNVEGLILLLEEEINTGEEVTKELTQPILSMVKDSINNFKTVIDYLTDIAKLQRDVGGELELVDLNKIVAQVRGNIPDLLAAVQVQFFITFEVKEIYFSRKNLYSIFYNLISNAIKYRAPGRAPEVTMQAKKQDNFVVFTIKDNGLGINEENIPKMFTLFKRFHSHVDGTGMGLYIVKRIIDNAGGKIKVESEEDKGTTFKLYFRE